MQARNPTLLGVVALGVLAGSASVALRGLVDRAATLRRLDHAEDADRDTAHRGSGELHEAGSPSDGSHQPVGQALEGLRGAVEVGEEERGDQ